MRDFEARNMKAVPFSGIRRIFEEAVRLKGEGKEIIDLTVGRPDFDTPVHIKEAAKRALDAGDVHYTSNYGTIELRKAIAQKLRIDNEIPANAETDILVTQGASEAIAVIFTSFLDPGDEVLIPSPNYLNYFHCASMAGARGVAIPSTLSCQFQVNPDDLGRAISARTKMIILSSPQNPTGTTLSTEAVRAIADLARKHDLLVLSDEIYEKLIYDDQRHISAASLPDMYDRTLTVNGLSKAYSMTGWRLGYVAAAKPLIDVLIRVHQYTNVCASSFVQAGGVAALTGSQSCVKAMRQEFDRRRGLVIDKLGSLSCVECARPTGAFYAFPKINIPGANSDQLALRLLRDAGVATVPGSAFGEAGIGHLRISYANSYENIQIGLARMAAALP